MPQSLDQVYLHTIFSTKNRVPFFQSVEIQGIVHAIISDVSNKLDCNAIKVGGVADHVHLLTKLPRTITIANFVKETKRVSTNKIQLLSNDLRDFHWQAGYGVFSVSASKTDEVESYICRQAEHHRTKTFKEEYLAFLVRHEVEYDERYVWD